MWLSAMAMMRSLSLYAPRGGKPKHPLALVWLFGGPGIRQATSVGFFCDLSRPSTMIEGFATRKFLAEEKRRWAVAKRSLPSLKI
ncbi:hypothetical protein HDF10_002421 [Edaphobacter lichenicola]|uniref:Uncharacterized protein n=1 Tax=Tunturiibacter lichenicola TaxID=2051959 RepID=A0A7W8JAL1_9BACT|nr:hypothetical protein [Edaphobacter lichenicola]